MDFSIIFQLREKKFWWLDVIFYFVMSLLIAAVFCYVIFVVKNTMQSREIKSIEASMETVGTDQQKVYEKEVIAYQKKFNAYVDLLKNHEFASHAFVFMEGQTRPNVWFKNFGLNRKAGEISLSGEADDMNAFSRQVAVFEKNEYVSKMSSLNSSLGESGRVNFNFNLSLDPKIFGYIYETLGEVPPLETVTPSL
jgi:hypothetical protein